MNIDIKLNIGIFSNQKIKKLMRKKGNDGVISLQKLWIFAAQHKPTGVLDDMDEEDIMDALDSKDEDFVAFLVDIKLLDLAENTYKIHDWSVHSETN